MSTATSWTRRWAMMAGAVLALVEGAGVARATVLRQFGLPSLTHEAHVILRGVVRTQEARWNDAHDRIYTHSRVEVLDVVKAAGPVAPVIEVKQIGGTVGDTTLTVVGTASFAVGEEVVLFLRTDGRFHYLVGMTQGKYGVRRVDGRAVVSRAGMRPHAAPATADHLPVVVPGGPGAREAGRDLDGFLAEVRRLAVEPVLPAPALQTPPPATRVLPREVAP